MTLNEQGLAMAGQFIFFSPERQPIKELKVQKKYKSSSKNFQPGLPMIVV
jgi:hypothetical protein